MSIVQIAVEYTIRTENRFVNRSMAHNMAFHIVEIRVHVTLLSNTRVRMRGVVVNMEARSYGDEDELKQQLLASKWIEQEHWVGGTHYADEEVEAMEIVDPQGVLTWLNWKDLLAEQKMLPPADKLLPMP